MPLVHVCWEKSLFGFMYHRAATPSLFKTVLSQYQHPQTPLVYGELFYAEKEEQLGSFTYNYNPLNQTVRTSIALWTGHEEHIVYRNNSKCDVVEWQYRLLNQGQPVSWACIHRSVKDALSHKTDAHIVLAKVTPIE